MTAPTLLPAWASHRRTYVAALLLYLGLFLVWLALDPGRDGGWIFDDYSNLWELTKLNHAPGWYSTFQYIANGISGPTHRPLALLTFAFQHNSWDQSPADFADFNILLHLLNATLVFWLLVRLGRLCNREGYGVPLLAALLWAVAPLQPSAILYIVQRMAVLAGTCVFAGTLLHIAGRDALRRGQIGLGYLLMSTGMGVGLVLGVLAKESAVVFPLLIVSLEWTLLATVTRPPYWRLWSATFLGLPLFVLAAYIVARIPQTAEEYFDRSFTMSERLLTEGRVMWMYVGKLVLPTLSNVRVLYDDLEVSRSWVTPWTTLPAVLAWIGVFVAALRLRSRRPMFSLAVLWFLSSHALESTFLPLELMFDHRNYFAIVMPIWVGVAGAAELLRWPVTQRIRPLLAAFAVCYVAAMFLGTRSSAALWGSPLERAQFWLVRQPESNRAYHEMAETLLAFRLVKEAENVYDSAARRWPNDPLIVLSQLELTCFDGHLARPTLQDAEAAIRATTREPLGVISMLRRVANRVSNSECPRYTLEDMRKLVRAGMETPALTLQQVYLYYDYAGVMEQLGNLPVALEYVDKAIARWPDMELFRKAVSLSLTLGDHARALRYVEEAEHSPRISSLHRFSYRREVAEMRHWVDDFNREPGGSKAQ